MNDEEVVNEVLTNRIVTTSCNKVSQIVTDETCNKTSLKNKNIQSTKKHPRKKITKIRKTNR